MSDYKTISIRGASLAYTEHGSGREHVILVHANISDIRSWDAIVPRLADQYHVVAYSRRYAWPNEPIAPQTADPWEDQAEDLAEVIKQLKISPCHILGNSTGATLALLVAKKYPELVANLFLEEPPVVTLFLPRTPPTVLDVLSLLWNYPWAFLPTMAYGIFTIASAESSFKAGKDEEGLQTFLHGVVGTETYRKLTPARVEQARVNMLPHKAILCHGALPPIQKEDVWKIAARSYLFTAEKTPGAQKCINTLLAQIMPNAEEVKFAGISHLMHEDDPVAIAEAIKSRIVG